MINRWISIYKEKLMASIGFVGGGNMAEALIKGVIDAGIYSPEHVFVSDISKPRLAYISQRYGASAAESNADLARKVDVLVLSVKPQNMAQALDSIKDALSQDITIVSIAAGVKLHTIARVLGDVAMVRVMPNTPALIGRGASALYANEKARQAIEQIKQIFLAVGIAVVVETEDMIDAVTAVSGSGPAYYFLLMEEMIKAAVQLGLSEDVARDLVLQTASGAALLAAEGDRTGQSPKELRRKVTSPGGTTEAALKVFSKGDFGPLLSAAINSAYQRSRQLSG